MHSNLASHYFTARNSRSSGATYQGQQRLVCSLIDEDGHLSNWVNDVFDIWDNALAELRTD